MSKWKRYRLEDCMDAIIDYRGKTPRKTDSGIPLITAKIIKNGAIQAVSEFISESDYDSWMRRGIPEPGDVVLTTEAPLGEVAQLDDRKIALAQRVITLRGKKGVLDNTFLKYLLISNDVQYQLDGRGTGTTVKGIKQSELRKIELPIPEFGTQETIAHILGSLDNKIELNRRMNETLEGMAQGLFKSWFVDFDPVRAKMDGRKTGIDPETAAMFPDGLEDSVLGKIPFGWKCGRLDDLLVLQRGFDLPVKQRKSGPHPVYAAGGYHGFHDEFKVAGPGVVTGRSGVLGKVFYIHEDFWPLNTTLWVKEFRASRPIHAYHLLSTLEFTAFNSGSAVPTLNRNHIHNLPFIIPPKQIVERFEEITCPLFVKCRHNQGFCEQLAKLRDTLLPKLISGELRIPDAEKLMKETK